MSSNNASEDPTKEPGEGSVPALQPLDVHNQELQRHVHPPDWVNPTPSGRYNLVVVGGGPAGLVAAAGAAGMGAKVALVERELLGGDCLNVGCVPSKALIRCARAAADVRAAGQFGVRVEGAVEVDFPAVMERMRRLRASMSRHDAAQRFMDMGIDVFLGEAKFRSPDTIEVSGQTLSFARALVATGARAAALPIPGLADAGFLTNETLFSLTELPARLAVIGGGPIGCEMAQAFARLGSTVTLIEAGPGIMPRDDPDAARIVHAALQHDGVTILCGSKTVSVRTDGADKVLTLACDSRERAVRVDHILVAVGRAPNVEALALEAAGINYDTRTGIAVNDYLQTSNPRVYAAGDVATGYRFTHAADAMARIVLQNALFFGRAKASTLMIPWCTYTDPEVAHVGLLPEDAKHRGIAVHTITIPLGNVDRAILDGEENGFCRVHLRKGSDRILGATIVARHAGDMITEISAVMVAGKGLGTLARTIHPYPTQSEAIKKAADAYNRTRLTPGIAKALKVLLAWRR